MHRMTPSEAKDVILGMPKALQPTLFALAEGVWDDGFGVGTAKLPRRNPFSRALEPAPETEKRGKKR